MHQISLRSFGVCPSWLAHAGRSNVRGHIASQSPAISGQPPREYDEISISLLVSHLAPRNHRNLWRNRSKIDLGRGSRAPKIESKLTPEPSEDTPWHPRAFQERLRSVLGRPRRSPACSRSIPSVCKDIPGGQKERPEALGSAPRQPESTPSRTRQ